MSVLNAWLDDVLSDLLEAGECAARSYIRERVPGEAVSAAPIDAVARVVAPAMSWPRGHCQLHPHDDGAGT